MVFFTTFFSLSFFLSFYPLHYYFNLCLLYLSLDYVTNKQNEYHRLLMGSSDLRNISFGQSKGRFLVACDLSYCLNTHFIQLFSLYCKMDFFSSPIELIRGRAKGIMQAKYSHTIKQPMAKKQAIVILCKSSLCNYLPLILKLILLITCFP